MIDTDDLVKMIHNIAEYFWRLEFINVSIDHLFIVLQ